MPLEKSKKETVSNGSEKIDTDPLTIHTVIVFVDGITQAVEGKDIKQTFRQNGALFDGLIIFGNGVTTHVRTENIISVTSKTKNG